MASLIFAHSKSIVNKAKKQARIFAQQGETMGKDYKETYNSVYDMNISLAMKEFDELLSVSSMFHERYLTYTSKNKEYFITIRPDDKRISFNDFNAKVIEYLSRKCFLSYTCSYEQKGTSDETLGKGFHCHIVATMRQKSKGEVLRDTLSSFKPWIDEGIIASNCIQVCITNNGPQLIQSYLIDYESEDNHKVITKEWDVKWRQENNILLLQK